ncbi:G1/S-specific cyclin-D2 [Habropoda laboriosa]|uniref:G1/S-specific cyclin-D2 n=1 Tax=Habropoda laboriosa TaxID=597456 RepID=A0A0L7R2D6_9HYME|nr:G1/S-specific cyclin-D2 [Habropoda laboriosa]
MDLLCCETTETECRAYADPALLGDDRVLQNLLKTEERYAPSSSYFECVQRDISPLMRKIVAEWMLEVSIPSRDYQASSSSTSRRRAVKIPQKGTNCLKQPLRLLFERSTRLMGRRGKDTILICWLMIRWEQLVVSKLKWELSAVTPGDFLMHILSRLPVPRTWDPVMVRRHAQTFIALSAREYKFSMYTPSMIAAASVAAALHGLDWTGKSGYGLAGLLDELTRITAIEQDYLQGCLEQIEEMVSQAVGADGTGGRNSHQVSGTSISSAPQRPLGDEITSQEKILEHEKAGTPTDVRDVHF